MNKEITEYHAKEFVRELKEIVQQAKQFAYSAVNYAQIRQNWLIGQKIVEQEQMGKARAEYGKQVIKLASEALTAEFGCGYSETNIRNFRKFFLTFSDLQIQQAMPAESMLQIKQAVPAQLSWTHYERLMRVKNKEARKWYMQEASEQMWSYRTLERNINTLYYERMLMSHVKDYVEQEMREKTDAFQQNKLEFIKNPTVLEFLGLPSNKGYTETAFEQAIIDQMQNFLLELGKGFSFVARQQLIRTETADFYIDLVFYNYILKCFVIVELKTHELTHQDIGQLDMYLQMYDDLKKGDNDNPTIGILLCTETDKTIARYSVLSKNEQLFAAKYLPLLPTEEELRCEIERQKEIFMLQQQERENKS